MEMNLPLSESSNSSRQTTTRKHRSKPKIIYEKHLSSAKLKSLLKRILIFHASLIIGAIVIYKIGAYFASHVAGYQQGNLRRIASIFALEWGMAHLSGIIYFHLFSAFDKTPFMSANYLIRCKNERLRLYCLLGFGLIIILAHLNYLFYLISAFEVPAFLYDISAISGGIWIHLCLLSYAFTAFNTGLKIVSAFVIGRRFLDSLFKFRAIKLFSTSPHFQVGFTLLLTAILSLSHWYSSDKLVVRHKQIHLTRKTGTDQTLKVAVLTDLHAGAAIYAEQINKVVERVNELENLDAVFLIGDVIDAPRKLIEDRVESLQHLRSRHGTFYVTGNHEYYYGNVEEWFELFDSYGIRILKNRAVNLKGYCLVGLNDVFSGKSGIKKHKMDVHSIKSCPRNESSIVLAHNPIASNEILEYSKNSSHPVDLILSGHTHAGQYYLLFPLGHIIFRHFYGLYSLNGNGSATKILVSAGTLFQGAPMKMPFMAEIWQLEILPAT